MSKKSNKPDSDPKRKKKRAGKKSAGRLMFDLAVENGLWASAGAMAGAANYFYEFSMKPVKHDSSKDGDPEEDPYVKGRIWMNSHPLREDWYEKSDDGLRIHANFIPSPQPEGEHRYAICVHGYSDTSESVGQYAMVYRDRYGMNVLLPDLRGHGKSEGTYVGYGYHDRLDLIVWVDRILHKDPKAMILLHGISMGAATVMMTTGEHLPSNVMACVEDAGYSTAVDGAEASRAGGCHDACPQGRGARQVRLRAGTGFPGRSCEAVRDADALHPWRGGQLYPLFHDEEALRGGGLQEDVPARQRSETRRERSSGSGRLLGQGRQLPCDGSTGTGRKKVIGGLFPCRK